MKRSSLLINIHNIIIQKILAKKDYKKKEI